MCKICSHAHWANEPHKIAGDTKSGLGIESLNVPKAKALWAGKTPEAQIVAPETKTAFDKKAYMRDYMAKKRKREREAK